MLITLKSVEGPMISVSHEMVVFVKQRGAYTDVYVKGVDDQYEIISVENSFEDVVSQTNLQCSLAVDPSLVI